MNTLTLCLVSAISFAIMDAAPPQTFELKDSCQDGLCLRTASLRKGRFEHTLSGFITSEKSIETLNAFIVHRDPKRGTFSNSLQLKSMRSPQYFEFKIPSGSIRWEFDEIVALVTAVHSIAPVESSGIECAFNSLGSRLRLRLHNMTQYDLILDYSLLTLSVKEENYRLNGVDVKYNEISTPKPNALIPRGTAHSDELIPVKAVKLNGGQWVEGWLMHDLLVSKDPALFVTLKHGGESLTERVPLAVDASILTVNAKNPAATSAK